MPEAILEQQQIERGYLVAAIEKGARLDEPHRLLPAPIRDIAAVPELAVELLAQLDLLPFKDCLWHDEASRTALLEMIGEFSRLYGYQQLALTRELLSLREAFKQLQGAVALRIGCKAVKRKQWFGRRARGTELPLANARPFGKLVHFQLLTPAVLATAQNLAPKPISANQPKISRSLKQHCSPRFHKIRATTTRTMKRDTRRSSTVSTPYLTIW
jgi:hypothetical protein